jgi:hypothetical protein
MVATLIPFDESLSGWERALYAFLAEKERRSGSRRTVEGYSRMLQHFFGTVGKPPERRKEFIDEVFQEIQFDQHGIRVVLPRTEYRALVALTEASRGGEMVGATGFEPATS